MKTRIDYKPANPATASLRSSGKPPAWIMDAEYSYNFPPRLAEDGRGGVHLAWMDKRNGNDKFDIFYTTTPSYHAWEHRHAVGDFDGGGIDELAADFGAAGVWQWNGGVWAQISANNPD
jgi:hypothetical protein